MKKKIKDQKSKIKNLCWDSNSLFLIFDL